MDRPSFIQDIEDERHEEWNPFEDDNFGPQQTQSEENELLFCKFADWDENKTYNEDPPKSIHYSMEWRVRINNREISKDTEQYLVLEPTSYWRLFLQPKLGEVLQCKMMAKKKTIKSEDTKIVISVTQRSERDVTKSLIMQTLIGL